jgi:very-short-patch-repair endonuclease
VEEVEVEFDRARHRDGATARARRLRAEARPAERLLWNELRALKQHWRRQAPLGRFVVDFANHRLKQVVEVDGGVHELHEVRLRDTERDAWLTREGYRVMRFTNRQIIFDMPRVIATITASPLPLDGGG